MIAAAVGDPAVKLGRILELLSSQPRNRQEIPTARKAVVRHSTPW